MKHYTKRVISRLHSLLFSTLIAVLFATPSLAQIDFSQGDKIPDVRVLIDVSGSMKQNDPQNLRKPALELLVQLFPDGAKAGVWSFGQWVNMLVPHQPVDNQWRANAMTKAKEINSVAMRTNIPEALTRAVDDLEQLDPRFHPSIILLTDGVVDVSAKDADNQAARQRVLEEILPRLRQAGVTVYTVALSQNADLELMEKLAIDTNGLAAVAETAEDLTRIFLQAFDSAVPSEQLPIENNRFLVDGSVEEFTALIFHRPDSAPTVLISPDGKRYNAEDKAGKVSWYKAQNYDLITINKPQAGEWLAEAELQPDSRVTVVSNLNLKVNRLDRSLFLGNDHQIAAVLEEDDKLITDSQFLELVDLKLTVRRREDGKGWQKNLSFNGGQKVPGQADASLDMLDRPGVYDVTVTVDGKSFRREQRQTVQLRDSFTQLVRSDDAEPPEHSVIIESINPALDLASLQWIVRIKRPGGGSTLTTMPALDKGQWALTLDAKEPGRYQLDFSVSGRTNGGDAFEYHSEPLSIVHKVAGYQPPAESIVPTETARMPAAPIKAGPETAPEAQQTDESNQAETEAADSAADSAADNTEEASETDAEQTGTGWKTIAFYIALGLGNLLLVGLGYFVYKIVMSKKGSVVLDESDDAIDAQSGTTASASVAAATTAAAAGSVAAELLPPVDDIVDTDEFNDDGSKPDAGMDDVEWNDDEPKPKHSAEDDILDLPDDAIDIDPASDDED